MNATETQALIYGVIGGLISIAGTAIAVSNWINARFDLLKTRLIESEKLHALEFEKIRGDQSLGRAGEISHFDLLEYRINSNTELINHRTQRFQAEIKALDERVGKDLDEIKAFLAKTTEFVIRGEGR